MLTGDLKAVQNQPQFQPETDGSCGPTGVARLMRIAQAWPNGSFNGAIKNRSADPRERGIVEPWAGEII